jgi:hypothetical protein
MEIYGFFFGDSNRDRKARDSWRPSVIAMNALSPINEYRTCFGCGGSGSRTFECCPCGTGRFERPAEPVLYLRSHRHEVRPALSSLQRVR